MPDLGTFGGSSPKQPESIGGGLSGGIGNGGSLLVDQARDVQQFGLEGSFGVPRVSVGSFSIDTTTASGTTAVTGVGFKPRAVRFMGVQKTTLEVSMGNDDGTNARCLYFDGTNWDSDTTVSLRDHESGVNFYTFKVASLDIDGFTITRTKTGSPTGTFVVEYECIG